MGCGDSGSAGRLCGCRKLLRLVFYAASKGRVALVLMSGQSCCHFLYIRDVFLRIRHWQVWLGSRHANIPC
jgi:hypothetical protein